MTDFTEKVLRTALRLAGHGMPVFPCRPRGKQPLTKHGFKDATTDASQIEAWWANRPDANLAIATGAVSKLFVLDVDGPEAMQALRGLERKYKALPPTIKVLTTKGSHFWFRMPAEEVGNTAGKLGRGLDTRGEGGYVLAPPSIHPSGLPYEFCKAAGEMCGGRIARVPSWLVDKALGRRKRRAKPGKAPKIEAVPARDWGEDNLTAIGEGQRNDMIARVTGHLLRRRVNEKIAAVCIRGVNQAFCNPPLDDDEVARTFLSILNKETSRRKESGH